MTGRNGSPLAQVIVVVGARGGAGASSLAVALAHSSAQEGKRTVLLDADELGGGIDLVLGAEGHRGVRWSELAAVDGELPSQALFDALAVHRGVHFLSCRTTEIIKKIREKVKKTKWKLMQQDHRQFIKVVHIIN